ncbi:DUF5131 family protein [Hoeflea sp. TYP-13]|uniref:DUF5131 family protein n=1 Tax=Hoeflea sp. TYP-13 TaxID=3230023 RepID=UPI0034C5DCA2
MADGTKIEWCSHPVTGKGATWNIITGCQIESPGCRNCYAMRLAGTRLKNIPSRKSLTQPGKAGPVWTGEIRFNEEWLTQPLHWKAPRAVFVCAHGDLFADGVTDDMLDRVFAVMALTPRHIYQVLTKRPKRMREYLSSEQRDGNIAEKAAEICNRELPAGLFEVYGDPEEPLIVNASWPLANVWLGTSVEDQKRADERIPYLLDTPAAIRFVSAEPLLEPLSLVELYPGGAQILNALTGWSHNPTFKMPGLDWIIVGGESGPGARPMHPMWPRGIRNQCLSAGVPLFFKQWGAYRPKLLHEPIGACAMFVWPDGRMSDNFNKFPLRPTVMQKTGKSAAGNELDGKTYEQFPEISTDD